MRYFCFLNLYCYIQSIRGETYSSTEVVLVAELMKTLVSAYLTVVEKQQNDGNDNYLDLKFFIYNTIFYIFLCTCSLTNGFNQASIKFVHEASLSSDISRKGSYFGISL